MQIEIVHGDITKLSSRVDVIVNAANPTLLGGGGVDGAIHAAAGPGLLEACRALGGCEVGDAKITGSYDILRAKAIVHAVGPDFNDPSLRDEAHTLLASAYRRSMEVAAAAGATTIAFPAISTGIYGFPKAWGAQIAAREVGLHAGRLGFEKVIFTAFDLSDVNVNIEAVKGFSELERAMSFTGGIETIGSLMDDFRLLATKYRDQPTSDIGQVFDSAVEMLGVLAEQNIASFQDPDAQGTDTSASQAHYAVPVDSDGEEIDDRIPVDDDSDDAVFAAIRSHWHSTLRTYGQPEDRDPTLSFQRPDGGDQITVRIVWPDGEFSVEHWIVR